MLKNEQKETLQIMNQLDHSEMNSCSHILKESVIEIVSRYVVQLMFQVINPFQSSVITFYYSISDIGFLFYDEIKALLYAQVGKALCRLACVMIRIVCSICS